jgi:hypothetical protein
MTSGLFGYDKKYIYRVTRINIDLDTLSLLTLYWCLFIIKLFGYQYETTVRISPSGHGRHVVAWSKQYKGLHRTSLYLVRILALDDRYRVFKDKQDRMIQLLWDEKRPISEFIQKLEGE